MQADDLAFDEFAVGLKHQQSESAKRERKLSAFRKADQSTIMLDKSDHLNPTPLFLLSPTSDLSKLTH